jgi:hypothetical protein
VAKVDAPYDVLPAAVYRESEVSLLPLSKTWTPLRTADRDVYIQEVHRGVPLGGEYYLRRFPVWFDFRGNSSVLLSEAKALSAAGHLRGDIGAEDLAQEQAQWIVGRNPFSASIMYGEGYDWTPLYSVRSGQMVGAIPVGIETKGTADAPYWPDQSGWTYKEVWTQPVGEWIWLMQDLSGPAVVRGIAEAGTDTPVELVERKTGKITIAYVDPTTGSFRAVVAEGHYRVQNGAVSTSLTALSAGLYEVDLRKKAAVELTVSSREVDSKQIVLQLSAKGEGVHSFTVRVNNLELSERGSVQVDFGGRSTRQLNWHARVLDTSSPWVAVLFEEGSLRQHLELTGIAGTK